MKTTTSGNKPLLRRHHAMVADPLRTPVLEKAIHKIVKPGDVVFDLGCGTGVLTLMALKAGAKKVYACEIDDSINIAEQKIKKAGHSKKVTFFHGLSSEIKLPEKVDVILAETVGSLGFNENILPFVTDARRRFLKKGGVILPAFISVFAAPLEAEVLAVPFRQSHDGIAETSVRFETVDPKNLLSPGLRFFSADLLKTTAIGFDREKKFVADKDGVLTGFASWFEAEWGEGIVTKTSPWNAPTHWKQALLPNVEKTSVKKGDTLIFRLILSPKDEIFSTETVTEWGFEVKNQAASRDNSRT